MQYIKIAIIERNPNHLESSKYLIKVAEGDCEYADTKFALVRPNDIKEILAGTSLYFTDAETGIMPKLYDSEVAELNELLDSIPENIDYIVFTWH